MIIKFNKKHLFLGLVLLGFLAVSWSKLSPVNSQQEQAPAYFKARFKTTKGDFEIEAKRSWSPKGVDRLYQLIKDDYYSDVAIYRVIPNYIAQFGINNHTNSKTYWENLVVSDEPVVENNLRGSIAFARDGANSRTTELFINLSDNSPYLDTLNYNQVKGFPVVAKVIKGMHVVESLYDGYGAKLGNKQDSINQLGSDYLKLYYPKLDYIQKVVFIDEN